MQNTKNVYQFEVFNTDTDRTYGYLFNAFNASEAVMKAYCDHNRMFGDTGRKYIKENISRVVVDEFEARYENFICSNNGRYISTLE